MKKFNNRAALNAGVFIVVIISLGIGLAFFTIIPDFITTATDSLPATTIGNITATILNLVPFVVGSLFIAFPLAFLVLELRAVS